MMKLRSWVESSNTLCLDLRSKIDFKACHLKSSTNIPLSQLSMRQSELPPKRLPFAVLEPLNAQGCSSWLTEHGWDIPWVFWEGSIQWKEISEWTSSKDSTEQWLLFQPSPFLEKNIELIEETLPSDRDWQCLDIGCGSGRDIGWILSRSTPWKASAFDALQGAMVRTDLLVRNLNVSQHMNILAQAKLLNNGKWKLISNAWWNNKKENVELQDSMDEITKRLEMSELENRNQEELSFTEFYKSLSSDNNERFDLILNIRFLSRPFLHLVPDMLNVGGSFVISHFVHDEIHEYSHPKRSLRLELNEISDFYKNMSYMEVIKDVIEESEDGRPINSIIVRRIS